MVDARFRSFFVQPTDTRQRQYEALRAFFVDQQPMSAIARQFGYRHDTVRRLVSHFRRDFEQQRLPPFSSRPPVAAPRRRLSRAVHRTPSTPTSPTSASCR